MTDGQKIYKLRQAKHISQKDIAEALGITRQTVSKWENDLMPVSEDKQEELAKILGVESLSAEGEIAVSYRNGNCGDCFYS